MMQAGKGPVERVRRVLFTVFFMLTMFASLLLLSAPVLVAVGDVAASLLLASRFACVRCYGLREHFGRYGFRSSLMDIPLLSVVRSLAITCVYSWYEGLGLINGPYFGTAAVFSSASILILILKTCLFNPSFDFNDELPSSLASERFQLKMSWGMTVLFLSSLIFALGHFIVAYRTTWRARRKFQKLDPEAVSACNNVFSGFQKVPRSLTTFSGKFSNNNNDTKRRKSHHDDLLPISLLADADSLFIDCQRLLLHYKISHYDSPLSLCSSPFAESNSLCIPMNLSPRKLKRERSLAVTPKSYHLANSSFNNQFHTSSLCTPLLPGSISSSTFFSEENAAFNLEDPDCDECLPSTMSRDMHVEDGGKLGVVLIHGFGGGVFSWRHVMRLLSRQLGCPVVAFDRPGWGLTSRPCRKDWEKKQLPNPYKIESQVDLLLSFCTALGFSSVILVGHDDGGLLAMKTAEKIQISSHTTNVELKGVVLVGVSLSREVVPAFARILLHTSLGKKRLVRPLLRAEITQVINHHAWYDPTKLTPEVLNLYKAPLFVEGWDEALHEIGHLTFGTVLSPPNAEALLEAVGNLPVLIVAGAEDALVSLKSAQTMASKLVNSTLVAISGCGHLPHEECPSALLSALSPFITRLLLSEDIYPKH